MLVQDRNKMVRHREGENFGMVGQAWEGGNAFGNSQSNSRNTTISNQHEMNAHITDLAIEGHLPRLLEKLKIYHEADLVDLSLNGDWQELVKALEEANPYYQFRIPASVREMYPHLERLRDKAK
jgi:hypothetical protein